MSADGYGLGIDIGASTITVAACTPDDARCAEPLHLLESPSDGHIGALLDRVGDPVPLYVEGRPVPAADAVAATIAEVVGHVAAQLGAPAARTVVTVPPSWTEHRRSALTAALADALDGTATLTSSAIAVARHGRATGTVPAVATVAVYDLGASTLDTAVVRAGEDGEIAHLAPPPSPLPWGGRDVDDAVVRHVRGFLPTAPATLRAACVAAKEALSTQTDVRIEVGERTRPIRLVREDLDELLADAVADSVDALRSAVTGAGLDPSQLDGVVLAGGSAHLPAVAEALSAQLGRPVLVTAEPELAAACGAAELALDLLDAPAAPTVELAAVPLDIDEPTDEDDLPEDDEAPYDEYDEDPDDELGERRRRGVGTAALSRVALVAALFVIILAAPVSLLAALDSGVLSTHGGSTASAADSPAAQTPAPDSPAAATGPAGTTSVAAHGTSTSSRRSTKATSTSHGTTVATHAAAATAAGSSAAASAAASSSTAAAVAPVAPVAPVDTTTATTDPGTTTPAAPPATDPPATSPPATDPPATNPPATDPPPSTDPAPPAGDPAPPATDPGTAQQAAA